MNSPIIGMNVPLLNKKPSLEMLRTELTKIDLLIEGLQFGVNIGHREGKVQIPGNPQGYVITHYDPVAVGLMEKAFESELRIAILHKLQTWRQLLNSAIETEERRRVAGGGIVATN